MRDPVEIDGRCKADGSGGTGLRQVPVAILREIDYGETGGYFFIQAAISWITRRSTGAVLVVYSVLVALPVPG